LLARQATGNRQRASGNAEDRVDKNFDRVGNRRANAEQPPAPFDRSRSLSRSLDALATDAAAISEEQSVADSLKKAIAQRDARIAQLESSDNSYDAQLREIMQHLRSKTQALKATGLKVQIEGEHIHLEIDDKLLFEPGDVQISTQGYRTLRQISPDNWELSALRATRVVKELEKLGVPAELLIAAGRADSQPQSAEKALNRRTEIVMIPRVLN